MLKLRLHLTIRIKIKQIICFVFFAGLAFSAFAQDIPHVTDEMRTAEFWIQKQESPDKVIMDESKIEAFNRHIRDLKLIHDLSVLSENITSENVRAQLQKIVSDFSNKEFYLRNNEKMGAEYFEQLKTSSNLDNLPETLTPRYGLITSYADQRFFPTTVGLYAKQGDFDFDELQNSALNIGSPIVILHESLDGNWFYVQAEDLDGWIEKSKVGLCNKVMWKNYQSHSLVTVISAKAKLFKNEALTEEMATVQMGTQLQRNRSYVPHGVNIYLPQRDQEGNLKIGGANIKNEDVLGGFLPYTQRNIIEQAFKLLDKPYGWGGVKGEQDCSRFLQEIFSTFGIRLPRNTSEQEKVGKLLAEFTDDTSDSEKLKLIQEQAVPGITLLKMKGHIMLYLGIVDNKLYAIHATWGYRKPTAAGEDEVCVLNRVVVSDLSLGEGSKKGSLLKRITHVKLLAE